MKKTSISAAMLVLSVLLNINAMVLAEQNNDPAAQKPGAAQDMISVQSATAARSLPEKAGLSRRNKAKLDQAEQRKIRQDEINKERAAEAPLQ